MKAVIEFTLPEEKEEFEVASNSMSILFCIKDFDNYLRSQLKYNDGLSESERKVFQGVRDKLFEEFDELIRFL